jgi:hypothetical protein
MVEIYWNVENTQILCKLFGGRWNRPNTYLNSVGYSKVEKGLKDRLGIVTTSLSLSWS